jgi:hypothetical protein
MLLGKINGPKLSLLEIPTQTLFFNVKAFEKLFEGFAKTTGACSAY